MQTESLPRLTLALVLAAYGALLRWGPRRRDSALPLPWAKADADIAHRTNHRLGILLFWWGAWLAATLVLSFTGTWLGTLVAPLVLVVLLTASHSARLYVTKYETYRVRRMRRGEDQPFPRRGGWWVVAARELIPMAAFLAPLVFLAGTDLPDRIPVRLSIIDGPTDWRLQHEALALLRRQTRFAYLVLLMGEAAYLVWRRAGKPHRSLAPALLSRGHWKFFVFRTGWIALFGGLNLGLAAFALSDRSLAPYLAPGVLALAAVGFLNWWDQRRTTYVPPPRPTER